MVRRARESAEAQADPRRERLSPREASPVRFFAHVLRILNSHNKEDEMVVQTSYGLTSTQAIPGQIMDSAIVKDHVSRVNQEDDPIPFGIGVVVGDSQDEAALPTSVNNVFLGVSRRELVHINEGVEGEDIPSKDTFSVLKRGRIWVKFEEEGGACAEGGKVFMRIGAGGLSALLTQKGAFCAIDDATTAGSTVRVVSARWAGANVGAVAPLELLGPSDSPSLAAT